MPTDSKSNSALKIVLSIVVIVVLGLLIFYLVKVTRKNTATSINPEYQGVITQFGIVEGDSIVFSFSLAVNELGVSKSETFFFTQEELKGMKITNKNGEVITYKELVGGQKISLKQQYGLKDPPHFSIEIKVLK